MLRHCACDSTDNVGGGSRRVGLASAAWCYIPWAGEDIVTGTVGRALGGLQALEPVQGLGVMCSPDT